MRDRRYSGEGYGDGDGFGFGEGDGYGSGDGSGFGEGSGHIDLSTDNRPFAEIVMGHE